MVAKYLLVAGYCASYNPAKSDLRLFGRGTGPEGRKKKGGGTRRAGYGRVRIGKVSIPPHVSQLAVLAFADSDRSHNAYKVLNHSP